MDRINPDLQILLPREGKVEAVGVVWSEPPKISLFLLNSFLAKACRLLVLQHLNQDSTTNPKLNPRLSLLVYSAAKLQL